LSNIKVISPEHTDGSVPIGYRFVSKEEELKVRNEQVEIRADNLACILDTLQDASSDKFTTIRDKIDWRYIAAMGHSFGGGTAILAMKKDSRITCAASLDGWMVPLSEEEQVMKTPKPILFLNSDLYVRCQREVLTFSLGFNGKPI
jgi:platelet-activating factor acetylhydrolase